MERVRSIHGEPIPESQSVCVLIGETGRAQRHIGILHRQSGHQAEVLHLAWHCRLENSTLLPKYMSLWIAPNYPEPRLRSLAAWCRRIWKANSNDGIPYAFSHPDDCFDIATAKFLMGPSVFGLTCASFVLAVLDRAGLRLVDYSTWPIGREGDQEWQEKIITDLSRRAASEHIEHVRSEIGAVRYRPEEVAAAVAHAPPPAPFDIAAEIGGRIVDRIQSLDSNC